MTESTNKPDRPEDYIKPEATWTNKDKIVMYLVYQLRSLMTLTHVNIFLLSGEPSDPGQLAKVVTTPGYPQAALQYHPGLLKFPPKDIIKILIHELVHIIFERQSTAVDIGLQSFQTKDKFAAGALDHLGLHYNLGHEYGVEMIAVILADAFEKARYLDDMYLKFQNYKASLGGGQNKKAKKPKARSKAQIVKQYVDSCALET